jgi:hypothetical protein
LTAKLSMVHGKGHQVHPLNTGHLPREDEVHVCPFH